MDPCMTDFQRGFVPIELDRPRLLRFTLKETWLLIRKYGDGFLMQLYEKDPDVALGIRLKDPDVMAGFLLIGLSADAEAHGEQLTLEQVEAMVTPVRFLQTFTALVMALTGTHAVPSAEGNGEAGGARVEAAGAGPTPPGSTSPKRKAGLPRRSASRRRSSGR